MIQNIFFKENLYSFLLENDSMFNKYKTSSIIDYSYIYSKELLMEVILEHDKSLYLKFKSKQKFRIFENIEEYFDAIDSFLENEKITHSHFLFEKGEWIKITKTSINKSKKFEYSDSLEMKKTEDSIKNNAKIYKSLGFTFNQILTDINNNYCFKNRIIVENFDDYFYLIDIIYKSNMEICFKEYRFLKDSEIYYKVIKYLTKNDFNQNNLLKVINVNTSDYYGQFFNNFIYKMILDFSEKDEFLFYMHLYKDLYITKEFNNDSNIIIEPLEFLSLLKCEDYIILSFENLTYSENDLKYFYERSKYIINNLKTYVYKSRSKNQGINILNIINDDK